MKVVFLEVANISQKLSCYDMETLDFRNTAETKKHFLDFCSFFIEQAQSLEKIMKEINTHSVERKGKEFVVRMFLADQTKYRLHLDDTVSVLQSITQDNPAASGPSLT